MLSLKRRRKVVVAVVPTALNHAFPILLASVAIGEAAREKHHRQPDSGDQPMLEERRLGASGEALQQPAGASPRGPVGLRTQRGAERSADASARARARFLTDPRGWRWPAKALLALLVPLLLATSAPALAASPSLRAVPRQATLGARIVVVGTNFPRHAKVFLAWDGRLTVAKVYASATGRIRITVRVPLSARPGLHRLVALMRPAGSHVPLSRARQVAVITVRIVTSSSAGPTQGPTPSVVPSPGITPTPTPPPNSGSTVVAGASYVASWGSDNNSGTSTSPWRTLQKAASTVPAGATVYVRGGTYSGFTMTRSGTSTAHIAFRGYPGETAILAGDSNHTKVIDIRGAHDIVVGGLTVQNAPAQWGAGIYIEGGAYAITIENTILRNNNSFGLKLAGVSGITVRNNAITKNETGIEISGGGAGDLINGNRIYANDRMVVNTPTSGDDRGANAIVFHKTTGHITVSGNTIWGNRAASYDYGYDGGAFEIYAASNITISGNTLWDNQNVVETGTDGTAGCSNNRFVHNVAYKGSTTSVAGPSQGMLLRCAANMLVANNTFDDLDDFVYYLAATGSFSGSIDSLHVQNNVATTNGAKIYSIDSAMPSSVVVNRNLSFNRTGGSIAWVSSKGNTLSLATLSSWLGFDSNGIVADPDFVNRSAGDYHLSPDSPAIDEGDPISGVTDGYAGSAPDIGRYEMGT